MNKENPEKPRLIVGLGNPGEKYKKTRHNVGFEVVKAFASAQGWSFKRVFRLKGRLASGVIDTVRVYLFLPTTYMNLSGQAVSKVVRFFKMPIEDMLVVVDDVYLKLGSMRLRPKGTSGGHNGLKSVASVLGTQDYCRLRIGVGPEDEKDLPDGKESYLEDYVLSAFTSQERKRLKEAKDKGAKVMHTWLTKDNTSAMQIAGDLSI